MEFSNLASIQLAISQKHVSVRGLVEHYLEKIRENQHLNAFLEVFEKEALQRASAVDTKIASGQAGRLAGMVIGIKDNICFQGNRVGASSRILEGFTSIYNATVVERLLDDDAVIIGRLNCDEFAMGSSNENSAFGPVKNPIDNRCVPGGSSGGSAAAVKAGLCLAALGSDTGGSIRQPAAFCGVVGLKPTYGRISRHGLIAYGSSFDQIGPITNTVEDAAAILEVIAGQDSFDSTCSHRPAELYSKFPEWKGKARIACLRDCLENEGLDPEVKNAVDAAIEQLRKEGHEVELVDFPYLKYLVPTYYVLTTAEASSNLARYDGMRYGYRSKEAQGVEATITRSRTEGFGKEVKRRIMLGTFVLSSGYYDAYYTKAQKVRNLIRQQTLGFLENFDFILTPTTPGTAFEFGKKGADPIKMYLEDIFTVQANITGLPAITIPLGNHSNGLPFGVQLMANAFAEAKLLSFSKYLAAAIK